MRRFLGPVLVGLGAFLVVLGLLSRFYAYNQLAVAPIDQNSVTRIEAKGATLFDTATLSEVTTDLLILNRTAGDVSASEKAGDDIRVWASTQSTQDGIGTVRSRTTERTAFDANTAEAVNCCGNFIETTEDEREAVKREGLVFKYPFDTQKKTYKVWNATLGETVDAKYVKESEIDGLGVYQFQIVVPQTTVGEREVPASVLGEPDAGPLTAEVRYESTINQFVEPTTGAIVNQTLDQANTLAYDGEDRVTTTAGQFAYTQDTVKRNVDDYKSKASSLNAVKNIVPLVGIILGLILIGLGILLARREDNDQAVVGGGTRRLDDSTVTMQKPTGGAHPA